MERDWATGLDSDISIVSTLFLVDLFDYVSDLVTGLVLDLPFVLAFFELYIHCTLS